MALGYGGMDLSTAPDTGTNISLNDATNYSWSVPQARVVIQIHPTSTATLYVRWHGTASNEASTTVYDHVMKVGYLEAVKSPMGANVSAVSIYSDAAQTIGTHFTIRGTV